jgi:hypothetical protein
MTMPLLTLCHPRQALRPLRPLRKSFLGQAGVSRSGRRGTSLLEVMFAMGVSVIGLLGVAAMIPVAAHRMGRGIQADQVAAYGRAVVSEFEVRGMARRDMFALHNGSGFDPAATTVGAFCFDPQIVAESGTALFPALPSAPAQIPRVTSRMFVPPIGPGDADARRELVDSFFRFHDDLVFDRPLDRTLPPLQLFDSRPVPVFGEPVKRQYNGRYTWMATLSPNSILSSNGYYTLSVVVFDGRDLNPDNEIVLPVQVEFGEGGGEIQISPPLNPGVDFTDLGLRPDRWIMLFTRNSAPAQVRWYRIASVDTLIDGGVRHGYLRGADLLPGQYEAVFHRNVVGVFEKTVRLEGSSFFRIPME